MEELNIILSILLPILIIVLLLSFIGCLISFFIRSYLNNKFFDGINVILSIISGVSFVLMFIFLFLLVWFGRRNYNIRYPVFKRGNKSIGKYIKSAFNPIIEKVGGKFSDLVTPSNMRDMVNTLNNDESPFNLTDHYTIINHVENGDTDLATINDTFELSRDNMITKYVIKRGWSTSMGTLGDTLRNYEKLEKPLDHDLLIPVGKESSGNGVGHYVLMIVQLRESWPYSRAFLLETRRKDNNPRITQKIKDNVKNYFGTDLIELNCALQQFEDAVNCGYYTFKMIYNYLSMSIVLENTGFEHNKHLSTINAICPGGDKIKAVGKFGVFKRIMRKLISNGQLNPRDIPKRIYNEKEIFYLTPGEKLYLKDVIKQSIDRRQNECPNIDSTNVGDIVLLG